MATVRARVGRAVGAADTAREKRNAAELKQRVAELKAENKRLHDELKAQVVKPDKRPRTWPTLPQQDVQESTQGALDDGAREIVDRFHVLYREVLHLDKYAHWRGTRVIKCPLDLWIYQELVFELEPDLIVETGTMDGGSALYFASLLDLLGTGEVVSVDKVDRPGRPWHPRIDYVLGSSVEQEVLADVRARAERARTVLVALDSGHTADHVHAELHAYGPLVTPGSYMMSRTPTSTDTPSSPPSGPAPWRRSTRSWARRPSSSSTATAKKFLADVQSQRVPSCAERAVDAARRRRARQLRLTNGVVVNEV